MYRLHANFDRGKVLQYLMDKLPNYMVPTHIIAVTKLPLSISGKIDRKIVDAWLVRTTRPVEAFNESTAMTNQLQKEDLIALELCSKVLSMVSEPGSSFFKSLHGTDFLLGGVGLDSIKIIHLILFIRQKFGVKVHLALLMDPKSSVRIVSKAIANLRMSDQKMAVEPKFAITEKFQAYKQKALDGAARNGTASMNIFLTGSTGYLGCRILRQLCRNRRVRRILVHVRSQNTRQALERITTSAKLAGWWNDDYSTRLEVWTGDLAKPKLGLRSEQWKRLCGHGPPQERATAIIHNGATVNWNASFPVLKATNVDSVVDLLTAVSDSASLTDFVYVSGGRTPQVEDEDDAQIAEEIGRSNGYTQTKFLSELLVKEYARVVAPSNQRISIVKPGYIIGSKDDGIAATDNFIWRLTASCARMELYSAEEPGAWLFVSDVDRVANAISDCCCVRNRSTCEQGLEVVKILDGLAVVDFWSIIKNQLGIKMQSSGSDSWMHQLNLSIDDQGEKHLLWPLLWTIEQGKGKLGVGRSHPRMMESDKRRVREAVVKNIEYLIGVGFLSTSNEMPEFQEEKVETGFMGKSYAVIA